MVERFRLVLFSLGTTSLVFSVFNTLKLTAPCTSRDTLCVNWAYSAHNTDIRVSLMNNPGIFDNNNSEGNRNCERVYVLEKSSKARNGIVNCCKWFPPIFYLNYSASTNFSRFDAIRPDQLKRSNFSLRCSQEYFRWKDVNSESLQKHEPNLILYGNFQENNQSHQHHPKQEQCTTESWQKHPRPLCNVLHEIGWRIGGEEHYWSARTERARFLWMRAESKKGHPLSNASRSSAHSRVMPTHVQVLGWGGSRTSYLIRISSNKGIPVVLKGPHYGRDEEYWYNEQRKDALILEKATSSPYIPDIYGYCGCNIIMEFSEGGSIHDYLRGSRYHAKNIDPDLTRSPFVQPIFSTMDKLRVSLQVASAVAALHELDGSQKPSTIAHNDICCHQFLFFNGIFKLNDFDHAKLLKTNKKTGKVCYESSEMKIFKMRAPEEMRAKVARTGSIAVDAENASMVFATDKIDVYLMGNVLYYILTNRYLFEGLSRNTAVQKIIEGERSSFYGAENSTHPAVKSMVKAIEMCWKDNPEIRPRSREVANLLEQVLMDLDKGFRDTGKNQINLPQRDHLLPENDWYENN